MNKDLIKIYQAQTLEKRISKIARILRKNEIQLEEMQRTCKHEVIVFTEEEICYGGYEDNLYQKCLFCGSETASRRSFVGSKCINVSKYKEENILTREEKFNIVKERFVKLATERPGFTNTEIADCIQEQLNSENEEFRKAMDEFHRKVEKMRNKD